MVLDGDTLSYDDNSQFESFGRGGFLTSSNPKRRVLDISRVVLFMNQVHDWDFACIPAATFKPDFPGLPPKLFMKSNILFPCDLSLSPSQEGSCLMHNGGYRPGFAQRDGKNWVQVEQRLFMEPGRFQRIESVYPHTPDQSFVQVKNVDTGMVLSYQWDSKTDRKY